MRGTGDSAQSRFWLTPLALVLLCIIFFRGYVLSGQPLWELAGIAHVWWGAWGVALLALGFGASAAGGLLAGITFGFSSFVIAHLWAGNHILVVASAWGVWLGYTARRATDNLIAPLALIFATGVLLGAVPSATTGGSSIAPQGEASPIPTFVLTLVVPDAFGEPAIEDPAYWGGGQYENASSFVGLWAMVAMLLAWRLASREAKLFGWLALAGLGISVAWTLLRPARGPGGALFPLIVGLAGAAGLVLTDLQPKSPEARKRLLLPAMRMWVPGGVLLLFAITLFLVARWTLAPPDAPYWRWWHAANATGESGLMLLGVGLSLRLWQEDGPHARKWAMVATFAVVLIDLWRVGLRLLA